MARADAVRATSPGGLIREIVARAGKYDAVVLSASKRPEQVAAAALARVRPRTPVFLQSSTWERGESALDRLVSRGGVRLVAGRSTNFCVLTRVEQERFPQTWGVDPDHVHLTPLYVGLSDEDLAAPVTDEGFVFAGGDSLRDYAPLIDAASMVDAPFRVAARRRPPVGAGRMPANVEFGPLPERDYLAAMRAASVVVVALAADTERSAGQNNYLNPMAMGKLVIVTAGTGVREYVEHGRTALVVPTGDGEALARQLEWALDPANATEARAIAERGRADVLERFSADRYVTRLLEVISSVLRGEQGGGARADAS